MVIFCAVCDGCTQTDIVREHLEDTLRICDVNAMGDNKGMLKIGYQSNVC